MSIFKHSSGDAKDASAAAAAAAIAQQAQTEGQAKVGPPFTPPATAARPTPAPGVVPPPAAPVYSMRPPEQQVRVEAEPSLADLPKRARPAPPASNGSEWRPMQRTSAVTSSARRPFDPVAATQAGLLNLAWKWQEAGAPIRAIHTYVELLTRYPDTPGADAAVADLVALSDILVEQGQFHTALAIYDHLEALLS